MARDVKHARVEDVVFSLVVENNHVFDGNLEEAARHPEMIIPCEGYCKEDKLLLSIRACELIMESLERELEELVNGEVK